MSERREEQKGPVDETAHRGQPLRAGRWESLVRVFSVLPGSRVKAFEGPEHLMVGSGEFQLINCTASCTDPKKLVLETHLNKTLLDSQAQWKLFKVANISKDEKLLCSFTCGDRQETKVFNITVFCECRPRGPAPRGQSLGLQTHTQRLCHCSWALSYGPHLPGLLDPGHGLKICSLPPLASSNPASNWDFEFAQRQTIQARFRQI